MISLAYTAFHYSDQILPKEGCIGVLKLQIIRAAVDLGETHHRLWHGQITKNNFARMKFGRSWLPKKRHIL